MKKFTALVLAILSLTVLMASAEKKLWTWKTTDRTRFRTLETHRLNKDGSGAFILNESHPQGPAATCLLVWVDKRGRVLLKHRFAIPEKDRRYPSMLQFSSWGLTFEGNNELVALRYGDKLTAYHFKVTKKKVVRTKVVPAIDPHIGTDGRWDFKGYVQYGGTNYRLKAHPAQGEPGHWGYVPAESDREEMNINFFSAWKR